MPTTRRPLARRRNPTFTAEVLSLFLELEHSPKRGEKFKAKERELARMLGLTEAWWTCNSVLDTSPVPYSSPTYAAWHDWHQCRLVREQLLAATGSADAPSSAQ